MTLQNYVDDVMQMADVMYTALELDRGTVVMLVNDARNSIYNETKSIVPWHYGAAKVNAANPYAFVAADRFQSEVGVYISPAATSGAVPARKTSRQELSFLTSSSYNAPTTNDPVYNLSGVTITAYPNTITNIDIDYSQAPTNLVNYSDTENLIPYIYQQLVVRKALISAYEKLSNVNAVDAVRQDFEDQLKSFKTTWQETENQARIALQSKQNFQSMR